MKLDLTSYFLEYEALVSQIDTLFQKVATNFSQEVKCKEGCSDCCHALFDITLIEALYINSKFLTLSDTHRNDILIEADKADRKASLLKRKISRDAEKHESDELLIRAAKERIRCPLLADDNHCRLYAFRPITCRIYGIPLEIGGKSHTCGMSDFVPGKPYPAVKIERIHDSLLNISNRILDEIGSTYTDFRLMHVPVSTAVMTVYNDEYFGLTDSAETMQHNTQGNDNA